MSHLNVVYLVSALLGAAVQAAPASDLPAGVRNVPGKGLCRERPPEQLAAITPVNPPPTNVTPTAPVVRPKPKPRPRGSIEGKITLSDQASNAHVVVYLEGAPGKATPLKTLPQVFQRDLAFVPAVTVVTTGSTIEFPNQDRVFHNIFSVSEPAKFDLGLYKAGESRTFTFTRPGVVDVYCNIHPQMIAKIKVLDTRYYAITGPDGSFRIDNVPEGNMKLVAWHSQAEEQTTPIQVSGGGVAHANLTLAKGHSSATHTRKDGTPYDRYK